MCDLENDVTAMAEMSLGAQGYSLTRQLQVLSEDRPGAAWSKLTAQFWPGWGRWYHRHDRAPETEAESLRAVRRHMPEMEALILRLSEAAPDLPGLSSFLSYWCPPRYLVSCSQAASQDAAGPYLIRNYDLDPNLNELTVLRTAWRGKRVIGMVDGLSGLSDGVNENGLAASLSFGGRLVVGRGFGVPMILRYILEVCTDVQDAVEALRHVPCHMSYNVTLTDRSGAAATVFLAPDRPAMIQSRPWATNHQIGVELLAHGRYTETILRGEALEIALAPGQVPASEMVQFFMQKPLYSTGYHKGYGTIFTSLYRPKNASLELHFKEGRAGRWSVDQRRDQTMTLHYSDAGSAMIGRPVQGRKT